MTKYFTILEMLTQKFDYPWKIGDHALTFRILHVSPMTDAVFEKTWNKVGLHVFHNFPLNSF